MKLKIISAVMLLVVICGLFFLVKYTSNIKNPEKPGEVVSQTATAENQTEEFKISRTFVIKAAHDVEKAVERLAFDEDKEFFASLSDLSERLKQSSDYLKTELSDFYGASYFLKLSEVFSDAINNPFIDHNDFSNRVSAYLRDIDSVFPTEEAQNANESDPENPMYYPVLDTANNGSFALSMLSVYSGQKKNPNVAVITLGGNMILGDTVLGGDAEDSFKKTEEKSEKVYPFYKISAITNNDSVTFANLKNPLTTSIEAVGVSGAIKGIPSYANNLVKGGIEAVSISYPGVLLYGDQGKSDTVSALEEAKCRYSDEATILYEDTEIGKIAFLTYDLTEESKKNNGYIDPVKSDIALSKANGAKAVIVHFNWINTSKDYWDPSLMQVYTVRGAIDNGADLVWATNMNSIEGMEKYKGVYILYSLGNLADKTSDLSESFLFQQQFALDEAGNLIRGKASIYPTVSSAEIQGVPRLKLDAVEVDNFKNLIAASSRTVRYGVNKKADFTLDEFAIVKIAK